MTQKLKFDNKLLVKDVNPYLTCPLCDGYLIDATKLVDCLHTFCKGCILKNFENKMCPICNTDYKKKTQCFRSDSQLQTLIYKLVPSLYNKEIQSKKDFYRSTTVRASSSCSDDSVIEREKTNAQEEEMILKDVNDKTKFISPDDQISLSIEYYQLHLDTTDGDKNSDLVTKNSDKTAGQLNDTPKVNEIAKKSDSDSVKKNSSDKRYLRCLAGVTMRILQKFIRNKFALTADHRVDIIYKGEVLQDNYSLMDVAYIFNWSKVKPMRFFYRIFTPMKVRPIKIVNTTLSTGGKQLQIVPVKPNSDKVVEKMSLKEFEAEEEDRKRKKEELMTQLQLQSKTKVVESTKKNCVFDYNETDEEIKKFAEKRDREWALQKKLDEDHHHIKKRKKNKHSKNDMNHKKRKLHAEKININNDDLKIKVKLTNGYKHKHHKNLDKNSNQNELSTKEKLLQMRQVRHKPTIPDEKPEKLEKPELKIEIARLNNDLKIIQDSKTLDQKIANLKQRCTIEPKLATLPQPKPLEKKVHFIEKPKVLQPNYPSGFTVSKIDQSTKRKSESEHKVDKRPSLEITLINPTPTLQPSVQPQPKVTPKRPPPATIPLDRIKKSVTLKNTNLGLSIIPKLEKCDKIGALDLTNHKTKDTNTTQPKPEQKIQLSNLQMLSKVATEQNVTNKSTNQPVKQQIKPTPTLTTQPKPKPQIPNLNTLKIPQMVLKTTPTLQKMPKLNEIKFKPQQTTQNIRNFRPNNQNQNIRNIPNPSLLIKQQNQRLNSFNSANLNEKNDAKLQEVAKIVEKNEISV